MDILEYYKSDFKQDLNLLIHSTTRKQDRISIVSLIETMNAPDFYGVVQDSFKTLKNKSSFLICYFYSVLFDQAIHSYDRKLHFDFDKIAGYPKFVGILSSYWSNFNPLLLLLISTSHIKDKENSINDFKIFTHYILSDYIDFFYNIFPKYTSELNEKQYTNIVLKDIFQDMKYSTKKKDAPIDIWDNRFNRDNIEIYYKLIDILQNEITICLLNIRTYNKS